MELPRQALSKSERCHPIRVQLNGPVSPQPGLEFHLHSPEGTRPALFRGMHRQRTEQRAQPEGLYANRERVEWKISGPLPNHLPNRSRREFSAMGLVRECGFLSQDRGVKQ